MQELTKIIEALLFASGEPVSIKKLANIAHKAEQEIQDAAEALSAELQPRGIHLLRKDDLLALVTAPETSPAVEELIKSELLGDLSKAALETLTIIAYQHPISRPDIDYIRGVNSSFTLRNLIVRGLVERVSHDKDIRTYLYRPTIEFMKYLGITTFQELPEYTQLREEMAKNIAQKQNE